MSLADKFKTLEPSQSGLPCGVAKMMESMSEADRDAFNSVMFDKPSPGALRVSNTKIHQTLSEEGYVIAPYSIAQHRRRHCRCFVGLAAQAKGAK